MRSLARRPLPVAIVATVAACLVAMGPTRGEGAAAGVAVTTNILTHTTLSAVGCASGLGVTDFGSVTLGVTSITSSNCTLSFGSSNAASSLRMYQQDGADDAMWTGSDGTLEQAFDGDAAAPGYPANGVVRTGTYTDAFAAATQADGKVVVAGFNDLADELFLVARYNRDGTLDATFDGDAAMPGYPGNGVVTTNIRANAGTERAYALTIQSDGKIVVAGRALVTTHDFAVVRYNANGTLDTTFDGDAAMPGYPGNGIVVTDIAGEADEAHAVVVRPDGRIVVSGTGLRGGAADFAVVQLASDGTLDTAFDGDPAMPIYPGNGRLSTPIGATDDHVYAMVLQPDGDVVVGGITDNGTQRNFAMARYADDGTLDTTFDGAAAMPGYPGNGKVTTNYGSTGNNEFGGLALQDDGKLVQSGSLLGGGSQGVAVARYNTDGSLDTSLDGDLAMPGYPGNGVVRTIVTGTMYTTHDVIVTPDSRIMVVADVDGAFDAATTIAYHLDGTLDTSFGGDGIDYNGPSAGDEAGRAITIGIDGRIVTAGQYNGNNLMIASYDAVRVPDWNAGVNDWTTTAFGTCLSATTGGAGWTPTLNCPAGTPSAWHAVPDHVGSAGNVVATSPLGVTNTTASLRFGFRPAATQQAGIYVAPVKFEVTAP